MPFGEILTIAFLLCIPSISAQTTPPASETTRVLTLPTTPPANLTCGENERATKCLPCEQDCDTAVRNMTTRCIGQRCFRNGPQFCECPIDLGFARDSNEKCVKVASCPIPGCLSGEQWSLQPCDGTCEVPQPDCKRFACKLPDCACKPGYVRFYDQCIPLSMCPKTRDSPCGECPAGQFCKRKNGWFSWFCDFGRGHKCEWYNPCGHF